jgi:signal peptidase I
MSTSKSGQDVVRERVRMLMNDIEIDVDGDLQLVRARADSIRSTSSAETSNSMLGNLRRGRSRYSSATRKSRSIAILAVAAVVVAASFAALTAVGGDGTLTVTVTSGGMLPTLQVGQQVAVDPDAYESVMPERGDIIAFTLPDYPDIIGIKRVIGLPGDSVEQFDGIVYVNGAALDEPYAIADRKTLGPWVVAPQRLFVMGDNRPHSNDSRYTMGEIPLAGIFGKVLLDRDAEDRSLPVPPAPRGDANSLTRGSGP